MSSTAILSPSKNSHVVNVTNLLRPIIQNVTKQSHNPCIYEIPKNLRPVNRESYKPFRVAIGPYHANYDYHSSLKPMQQYKELYLRALISRNSSSCQLDDYVSAISIEDLQKARQYYARADEVFENDEKLAMMLLIDSAFIVEFLCRVIEAELCRQPSANGGKNQSSGKSTNNFRGLFTKARNEDERDPIARNLRIHNAVCRDMILLENQVPYFILEHVFELTFEDRSENDPNFAEIAYHVLRLLVPFKNRGSLGREDVRKRSSVQVKHLVHLMWLCCLPFPEQTKGLTATPTTTPAKKNVFSKYFEFKGGKLKVCCVQVTLKCCQGKKDDNDQPITATQLQDSGVHFKATKKPTNNKALLANLSFGNGILNLPCLVLYDSTEMFFRNLIAFEQYFLNEFRITNYMYFMDSLIDTTKDVQILEECNVIENWLESKDDVTKVFNNIGRHTASDGCDFTAVSRRIKSYASRPWNRWKAMLRRDYFASPWAVVSFVAALVLLALTIVQTIASVRSVTW